MKPSKPKGDVTHTLIWIALGLAVTSSAHAKEACATNSDTMYCESAAAIVSMYPIWLQSNRLAMQGIGGDPKAFYRAGCSFVGADMPATIEEERRFALKDGAVTLLRVRFGNSLSHSEDRYSAEGEYRGKVKVTRSGGWTLRRDISCKPNQEPQR